MRPVGRDEGHQKLRSLRCFDEVLERLVAGWSMSELARFIQENRNEYLDTSRVTLMQTLQRFKDTIPPAQLLKPRMPPSFQKAIEDAEETVDGLKVMEQLVRMQMERLAIDIKNEKNIGTLMPKMTQEMRVAGELAAKLEDMKMDLGLNTRHQGQVDVEVTIQSEAGKYGKESVKKVMENPESRRKVLNVAERILGLTARAEKTVPRPLAEGEEPEPVPEQTEDDAEFELAATEGEPEK